MRPVAVLDSETDPFKHGRIPKPFIWGFYDGKQYQEFTATDDLVAFLYDKPIIVYAHNGGRFDYHFMLEHLIPYDDIKVISGRLAKFKIGLCEFRDSINIIPVPLAAYQKETIDYAIFEEEVRDLPENKKAISEYLESDCVYLYDLVTSFIDEYGCHLTQATASMKTWQKMSGIKPPDSTALYYDSFKQFYYGGRVQCKEKGIINEEFKIADINSAYPFAMLDEHPLGIDFNILSADDIIADHYEMVVGNYFYVVRCVAMGPFPFRLSTGELVFPNDGIEREYSVTGWELIAAKQTNTISVNFKILYIYYHNEFIDFAEYITYFYEKRKLAKSEGDIANTLFCKLFMNGLYGKFGANPRSYANYCIMPPDAIPLEGVKRGNELDAPVHGSYDFSGMLGPWILASEELDESEQRFYNVATAASITGYVRAYLWKAMCKCNGVLYCDTDSIFARDVSQLNFGSELGQWEIEGNFSEGAIAGKKLYACHHKPSDKNDKEWKLATKGVKLASDDIYRLCMGEEIIFSPEVPTFSIHNAPKFIDRKVRML